MRINPKYFNLFIGICAVLTIIIIFYSTVRYSKNQVRNFERTIAEYNFHDESFRSFSESDSLQLKRYLDEPRPLIIHFFSTWSGRSLEINSFLEEFTSEHPELRVIAATVRDSDEHIESYIMEHNFNFHFVEGTEFYQSMKVPGMPTQIMFNSDGTLFSSHVGDHLNTLKMELDNLLSHD